jgi:predicted ATPase/serine/threonine protein kinase/DNA-binding CsgD family transcriptional regulator
MHDLVGQQLGNYRLVRLLGRGGFAEVYLGEHIHLQSHAALKVLHTMPIEEQQAAFVQEAQTLVRLRHPHIVRLLDFALEAGEPFLVMDYAPGGSLRALHPAGTRLPLGAVVAYVRQVASALYYAHDQRLIHRDVKPENMLLGSQGELLLSDFGLALFTHQQPISSTNRHAKQVVGTSLYLAPEQLQGNPRPQSDQYALAAVVYEWLCGTPPFSGTSEEIAMQHLTMALPPLRRALPDLSSAVEEVILRALAKDPEQRFGTIQEFASALEQANRSGTSFPEPARSMAIPPGCLVSTGQQTVRAIWKVPAMLTSVVGREREVSALRSLLSQPEVRLVTLLGPGGIGKTRLSFQVAQATREQFVDGVCFIPLASVTDASLLIPAIAEALEIQERGEYSLEQRVMFALAQKQMLLILDNFEQLLGAVPVVEHLLTTCPQIKILVTSRAVLYVAGEHEFLVSPLSLPDLRQLPSPEGLMQYAAVALFVQRARAALSSFALTESNARAIAEICIRLDGLPLAIELAAARARLLPPAALLARLSQRLSVLTSGGRTLPERQQTLRNTLKWSYDLLDTQEQKLFRLLSGFVGGWTVEAVETLWQANAEAEALPTLDGLASLLDKSLLIKVDQEGEELRLQMLETVREYGWECVHTSGETEAICRAHAAYFLELAQRAEPHLKGSRQIVWLRRLEQEHENLLAALHWLIEQQETEAALNLAGALWRFWYLRGYWSEGNRWLTLALQLPQAESFPRARARALGGAGRLAQYQGNSTTGRQQLEACVALYRELEDRQGLAEALTMWELDYRHAPLSFRPLLEESIALARENGDTWTLATALQGLGRFTVSHESAQAARPFLAESAALFREAGDIHGLTAGLGALIIVETMQGNILPAAELTQEFLGQARALGNTPVIIDALYTMSYVALLQGHYMQAISSAQEGLALARELGDKAASGRMLGNLGEIAMEQDNLQEAAACFEEAFALFKEMGHKDNCAASLSSLGDARRLQGEIQQAMALYSEGFLLARELGNKVNMGWCLVGLALVAGSEGRAEQAALLFGAAEACLNVRAEMNPKQRGNYERSVEQVRLQLGEEMFTALWMRGQAMPPEDVVAGAEPPAVPAAVSDSASALPAKELAPAFPDDLTAREVEVLRLLAQGWPDAQIAEHLVISPRTVNRHTTSIYSKIGVSSRSAATRYAIEHHLA